MDIKKSIILTTTTAFGTKNPYLFSSYLVASLTSFVALLAIVITRH